MITQQYLKSRLRYDPETGIFTWINGWREGKIAGTHSGNGYRQININYKIYGEHRLAFLYVHGFLPPMIDHRNRIKDDNRIANLRECNKAQNAVNSLPRKSATGFRGVVHDHSRFRAQIKRFGKCLYLGLFDTPEEASAAYEAKLKELHGEFSLGL